MGSLRWETAIHPSFPRHCFSFLYAVNQSRSFASPALLCAVSMIYPLNRRSFITVNFYTPKGEKKTVKAEPGESILRIAQHNNIPLEGRGDGVLSFQVPAREEWRVRRAT